MVEPVYTSCGVNRAPHCLDFNSDGSVLIYASSHAVVVCEVDNSSSSSNFRCRKTLVAHTDRVNCVRFVPAVGNSFVSCSTDKSVVFWDGDFKPGQTLKGHAGSVTVVSGLKSTSDNGFMVASASADSTIKMWKVPGEEVAEQTINIPKSGFALDMVLHRVSDDSVMLFTALDDCKIHIYARGEESSPFVPCHVLKGHEDWVQCLDVCQDEENNVLLASGGQDNFIRLWKFERRDKEDDDAKAAVVVNNDDREEIHVREEIFDVDSNSRLAVSLETVLAGHEDKVFGVRWDTLSRGLLSCSMDKTMILWNPTDEGIWDETVRVGEVGGNTLGFLGCALKKSRILAYGFNGSLHLWQQESLQGAWSPGVVPGGHFGPVTDLAWETSGGRYLVSVSSDQSTRVHAPWNGGDSEWHEVARPQVHGHDLNCLTTLSRHRFASGADEKIVRVFEATQMFIRNLKNITGDDGHDDDLFHPTAQGASVPSLGLSNKAVLEGEVGGKDDVDRHVKDVYPDHYFSPESYDRPPPEEALAQNTLWPELQKLYGHGYEVFALASTCWNNDDDDVIIASACKASKAEHAEVILWQPNGWKILQKLPGHGLTVTAMAFSPNSQYLLTVSRDRTWCLYRRNADEGFDKVGATDKKKAVHQRLIWDCAWTPKGDCFATCSRDKKVAVWAVAEDGGAHLACKKPLILDESVTAVTFAPFQDQSLYVLAAGLEDGRVVVAAWKVENDASFEWAILTTFHAHHKTVKRLKFRPKNEIGNNQEYMLASCSADHAVKLHNIHITNLLGR